MSYFRTAIATTSGYIPGEQPKPGTKIIKLNTNENPYPPSPQAIDVLRSLDGEWLRRYPDPRARDFCNAVSDVLNVPSDWIIVGNGSDDLLNLLVRSCAEGAGRTVVYPTPTYVLYRTLAAIQPATVVEIPYPDTFQLPLERLMAANGAITFLASPNSPSGHEVPLEEVRQLAQGVSGLVVVDEAYVDFGTQSALSLVQELDNVVVLRTLSKGYSLAGLRLGFGIGHPTVINELFKVKDSYNIDAIAIALGTAAMQDQAHKNACAEKVKRSRSGLSTSLEQLGFTVFPSHGNFVLATPPHSDPSHNAPSHKNAERLYLALKDRGILVRYFNQPGLDDKLRITVGTDDQNAHFIDVLAQLLENETTLTTVR
ncbi:MAG: histidinol-phosphate transaminase [Merismopedia sp. SIO2A8]|nr:histidinol-phosphate transaminase [Merismopedia sp. SIO2A8]